MILNIRPPIIYLYQFSIIFGNIENDADVEFGLKISVKYEFNLLQILNWTVYALVD